MEWISVKDRLPDEGEKVLTYEKEYTRIQIDYIIFFHDQNPKYIWACRREEEMYNVSHWMPLPEPPKE